MNSKSTRVSLYEHKRGMSAHTFVYPDNLVAERRIWGRHTATSKYKD
jgi:hypothetical protein